MNPTHVYKGLTFSVKIEPDHYMNPPWKENDCHGEARIERKTYKKRPGERILHSDRSCFWVYDFSKACKTARHVWGFRSKRSASEAAYKDFRYLQGFACGDWYYQCVSVSLLLDGTSISGGTASLCGVESCTSGEQLEEILDELCDEALAEAKQTYSKLGELLNERL